MPNPSSLVDILSVALFRAGPFVGYAFLSRRVGWRRKLTWAVAFALLAALHTYLGGSSKILVGSFSALGYLGLVGFLVHRLERRPRRMGRGLLILALWLSCVGLPAGFLGGGEAAMVLVLGWEVMLSAYSYCCEIRRAGARSELNDCLFFLLVNPTLVYTERGTPDARPSRSLRGVARCLLGVSAWLVHDWLVTSLGLRLPIARDLVLHLFEADGYAHFLREYTARFGAVYLQQSGLASLQIGLMTLVGYGVPECYRLPFLARSPQEFWQRWNIWVGSWARRYVFFPSSLNLRRRFRRVPARVATASAVLIAFCAVGLLHDASTYVTYVVRPVGGWPFPRVTLLLLFCGVALSLWRGVGHVFRRMGFRVSRWHLPRSFTAPAAAFVVFQVFFLIHASTQRLTSKERHLLNVVTTRPQRGSTDP